MRQLGRWPAYWQQWHPGKNWRKRKSREHFVSLIKRPAITTIRWGWGKDWAIKLVPLKTSLHTLHDVFLPPPPAVNSLCTICLPPPPPPSRKLKINQVVVDTFANENFYSQTIFTWPGCKFRILHSSKAL